MKIGIDASRANLEKKTGTEWYSYHLIRHFSELDNKNQYILYTKEPLRAGLDHLGQNFTNKVLRWPPKYLWSQIRLSLEMLFNPPDLLFVPAHTIPLIHPKKTVTTCHDIGFEHYPELYATKQIGGKGKFYKKMLNFLVRILTFNRYSNNELDYHRYSMRLAVKKARLILTPSEFTAREIEKFYRVDKSKIKVTLLGYDKQKYLVSHDDSRAQSCLKKYGVRQPFLIFVGRLEKKKNIVGLIKSFIIFKRKFKTNHHLLLIGKRGLGFDEAERIIKNENMSDQIIELGWVPDSDISLFYQAAEALVFLSYYEGFGLPVVEAMACGLPVIASNRGSIPEILGKSGVIVEPDNHSVVANNIYKIVSDRDLRATLRESGLKKVTEYSWRSCAKDTLNLLQSLR